MCGLGRCRAFWGGHFDEAMKRKREEEEEEKKKSLVEFLAVLVSVLVRIALECKELVASDRRMQHVVEWVFSFRS